MTTDLIQRCARRGWTLREDGDGYELLGNGAPASFRSEESVRVWLDKQKEPRVKTQPIKAPVKVVQMELWGKAA